MSPGSYTLGPSARALLADLGVSVPDVLRRALLPQGLFTEGAVQLTPAEYGALWQALDDELGDPTLPITIARSLSAEVFDPPLFAAYCSPTLTIAATRIARFKPLVGPLRLAVRAAGGTTTIDLVWPDGGPPHPSFALTELLFWVSLTRSGTRAEVRPLRVSAAVEIPAEVRDDFTAYLGVPIQHELRWSITFSDQDANMPFLTANAGMWDHLEPGLRRRLADLDRRRPPPSSSTPRCCGCCPPALRPRRPSPASSP